MTIELLNLGKRFNRHWIFRGLSYRFESGQSYAIIGPNGSGKSTLLQVIAGAVEKSEGNISFISPSDLKNQQSPSNIQAENHFKQLTIAAPYLELIEEFTLVEFFTFHFSFKPLPDGQTIPQIIDYIGLQQATHQQIRNFSSGMKQRVKLAQAIFSNTPIVLLDEPTTNLDQKGIALYQQMILAFCKNRLLIVGSNDEAEIGFCNHRLAISDFKVK